MPHFTKSRDFGLDAKRAARLGRRPYYPPCKPHGVVAREDTTAAGARREEHLMHSEHPERTEAAYLQRLRHQAGRQGYLLRKGQPGDRAAWYIVDDRNHAVGTADHLDAVEAWLRTR